MSTAERKERIPMTPEERDAALAEIHANLDSIPDDIPAEPSSNLLLYSLVVFAGVTVCFILARGLQEVGYTPGPAFYFVAGIVVHVIGRASSSWLPPRAR